MNKFKIKLTIFLIPVFAIACFFEFELGKIPNSYNYKRTLLEKKLDSIEILILGNSKALYGINPEYLKNNAFNASNHAQTLYYDCEIASRYLDRIPNLKFVIIPITEITFENQLIDGPESWRDFFYSQFWGIDYPEINKLDIKYFSKIFLYSPKLSLEYALKHFDITLNMDIQTNGYAQSVNIIGKELLNINIDGDLKKVRTSIKKYRFPENYYNFLKLISLIKNRNAIPIFLKMPVLPAYNKLIDLNKDQQQNLLINSIAKKYHCYYFNHFNDDRFETQDFQDLIHLNSNGARKFTKLFNHDILSIEKADLN